MASASFNATISINSNGSSNSNSNNNSVNGVTETTTVGFVGGSDIDLTGYAEGSSPLQNAFQVNKTVCGTYHLKPTDVFSENIFTLLGVTAAECSGVQIYAYSVPPDAADALSVTVQSGSLPIRFEVLVGLQSLGRTNYFSLMDCDGSLPADITVSNIIVPTHENAILSVTLFSR